MNLMNRRNFLFTGLFFLFLGQIFCQEQNNFLKDEIYAELSYDQKFTSIASFDEIKDQVILISGYSKAYAMTGWRLGYVLANEVFIKQMNKIHQYIIMSAPTSAQYGAIEAMRYCDDEIETMEELVKKEGVDKIERKPRQNNRNRNYTKREKTEKVEE